MSAPAEPRQSPLVAHVVLLVAFLAIAVAGVFTVLIPELSDAGDEEEQTEDSPSSEGEGAAS